MKPGQDKILVIKLGALGDFIQALGPMKSIRRHHPHAHITLLTTAPFENFAKQCGYFNDVWIDRRPKILDIAGWMSLKKKLGEAGFSRVYDLQNNDRTSFYLWLFPAANKPEWIGAAKGASHRNNSPARTSGQAFDGHVQTLALAGIHNIQIDTLDWMDANISSFPLRRPYVLLIPGASPRHPVKRWPAEKYGRMASLLGPMGFQPVILGGEAERNIAAQILHAYPGALDLTAQTDLTEIAVLARGADCAIGNDTGPMHLIAATGCPSIVLFSSHSNPVRHAPKGADVHVLQKDSLADLSCEEVLKYFRPKRESGRSVTTH